MKTKLERAFEEASKLPRTEQEALAAWLLAELASDAEWSSRLAGSQAELSSLADEALAEHEAGATRGLDPDAL